MAAGPGAEETIKKYLSEAYPEAAEGLEVASVLPGAANETRAEITWTLPDGVRKTVPMVASPYLSRGAGYWLLPPLDGERNVLSPLLLWWCLLHALSQVARYHSAKWAAALNPDESEHAVPIERVLSMGLAIVPRLVLLALAPEALNL